MDKQTSVNPVPLMSAAGEVQAIEDPRLLLERALLAHWEHRYADAEALYQKALAVDPGLLSGRVWYAILLAQRGRPGEAGTELEQALEIDPVVTVARLETARNQEPNDDAILSLWGLLEMRRANRASARDWFVRVLHLNPDNAGALAWMAQVLVGEGDYAGGDSYLSRAQVLAPEDAAVKAAEQAVKQGMSISEAQKLLVRAQAEAAQGRLDVAETLFEQARQLQPADPAIRREYARFLVTSQRYLEAIEQLEAALALSPNDLEARQTLDEVRAALRRQREVNRLIEAGQAALQTGQWEEALRHAAAALAEAPDSAEAQALQAEAEAGRLRDKIRQYLAEADRRMAEEDYAGATAELEAAQQLLPGDEELGERLEAVKEKRRTHQLITRYWSEAQQKARDGDIQGAVTVLEVALQLDPESASIRKVHQQLVKQLEALELLAQARTLAEREPTSALELVSRAQDLAPELKDIEIVKAEVRAQLDAKERQAQVQKLRSEAERRYRASEYEGAEQALRCALELAPEDKTLQSTLRRWEQDRVLRDRATRAGKCQRQAEESEDRGEYEEAAALWEEALRLQPDDVAIRQRYAGFAERQRHRETEELPSAAPALPEPAPVELTVPGSVGAGTDAAIRHHAGRAVTAWQAGDMAGCLAAARQGYELASAATNVRDLGLQCGLVWLGLTWVSSVGLSEDEKGALRRAAEDIESHDAPLRANFNAHLLSHLTHAVMVNERYPLENLALAANTPDPRGRRLVEMVVGHTHLDDQARQELHDALAARATGEMSRLVLHTITELLRRCE
jgi:tetratricopeptide (TPR) repeat protein